MKKRNLLFISVALICAVSFVLSACSPAANGGNTVTTGGNGKTQSGEPEDHPATSGTRIRFDFDGQTVYGTLDDNSVSRDLVSRLPMTLTFSDYNGTEKIAYLPENSADWDTTDAPASCTPAAGDITMYAPWGNLALFYRSFHQSDGLVPLGRLDDGGAEKLAAVNGDFTVTISLVGDDPIVPGKTEQTERSKILVAYFSCTGNTKAVAEKIASLTGGDLYEIVPEEPYSAADLSYNDSSCRANREMNDSASRPAIAGDMIDLSAYDTVIIGYPIWWGTMPRIINTFFDTYDLSGKALLPFCTSGGSGVSKSVSDIKTAEPDADVKDGLRASGANDVSIDKWLRDNGVLK